MQVTEMHTEVIKHRIKDGGEDGIWETAGMAICLGVVQNYTFQEQASGKWAMIFNPKSDDDEDGGFFGTSGGKTPEEQAKIVQGLLLTKEVSVQSWSAIRFLFRITSFPTLLILIRIICVGVHAIRRGDAARHFGGNLRPRGHRHGASDRRRLLPQSRSARGPRRT